MQKTSSCDRLGIRLEKFLGFGGDGGSIRRLERLGIREDARTFGGVGVLERRRGVKFLELCYSRRRVYCSGKAVVSCAPSSRDDCCLTSFSGTGVRSPRLADRHCTRHNSGMSDLDKAIAQLRSCRPIPETQVRELCYKARELLIEEGNVVTVNAPVTVCAPSLLSTLTFFF